MSSSLQQVPAQAVSEGAGVTVYRTIGGPRLRHYDPFLLLDQISSHDPNEYIAGFPPHPHRGFNTFTYMIEGEMEHRDSMGNTGRLGPGGAQWMKAASGVIHSEMPRQQAGVMRGFQLWINLPAARKGDPPAYQEYPASAFPVVESSGARIKVLTGSYNGADSPIVDTITAVRYLDIHLEAGATFVADIPAGHQGFVYLFEGGVIADGHGVTEKTLLLPATATMVMTAQQAGARFLLVSGQPIGEPVVQHGPFVMNTREEIDRAIDDYKHDRLVQHHSNTSS